MSIRAIPVARLSAALVAAILASACASTRAATENPGERGATTMERYDVLIENGRIVDGMGNPWYYGDVAMRGDRIVAIARRGRLSPRRGRPHPHDRRASGSGILHARARP